jgi:hypothetical protein
MNCSQADFSPCPTIVGGAAYDSQAGEAMTSCENGVCLKSGESWALINFMIPCFLGEGLTCRETGHLLT